MNTSCRYPRNQRAIPQGRTQFGDDFRTRIETDRDHSSIEIDRPGFDDDVELTRSNTSASIDRHGFDNDVDFEISSSKIEVDRAHFENDVEYGRSSSKLEIDRHGFESDLEVKFSSSKIEIDKHGHANDMELRRRGDQVEVEQGNRTIQKFPVSMMPGGAWPESANFSEISDFINMAPETAGALDQWFQSGPDLDDLVRIDTTGQTYFYDGQF